MKILITGGTGSLGQNLAQKWHSEGHELTIISRDDHKQAALRAALPGVVFHSLDLGNVESYRRLLSICDGQELCVHAAAQKQVAEGQYQPFAYLYTNVLGTLYLLQAWKQTHGHCRDFLLVSSDKAVSALNFYGRTKGVAEGLARAEEYDGKVIRYGNVVTSAGSFLRAWQGQDEIIVRAGEPSRESPTRFFLTMQDAIQIIEEAVDLEPGIYVPGGLWAFDVLEVAQATDKRIKVEPLGPFEKLHESLLAPGEGWAVSSPNLGRVSAPHWPHGEQYYSRFRSDTAPRMSGKQVLEAVEWTS